MAQYDYRLNGDNVEDVIGVVAPRSTYEPFSSYITLSSGQKKGMGFPIATWTWGFLTRRQREALRAYCPGPSASVTIRTRTNEDSNSDYQDDYEDFSAIVNWPEKEEKVAQRRLSFELVFTNLVPI